MEPATVKPEIIYIELEGSVLGRFYYGGQISQAFSRAVDEKNRVIGEISCYFMHRDDVHGLSLPSLSGESTLERYIHAEKIRITLKNADAPNKVAFSLETELELKKPYNSIPCKVFSTDVKYLPDVLDFIKEVYVQLSRLPAIK